MHSTDHSTGILEPQGPNQTSGVSSRGRGLPQSNPPAGNSQKTLKDPQLKRELQRLRLTDNWTNWFYIARAWLVIAVAIGVAVTVHLAATAAGLSSWWTIPIFVVAIMAIGASQHQLAGATHEATHHTLFKNRLLNELASDWLCMFPLFSSTYTFRLHHLAHHQFINDPERDPDFAQLRCSGHWLEFPVLKKEFLWLLAKQLWVVNLIRYTLIRARYNSIGVDSNIYIDPDHRGTRWPNAFGLFYVISFLVTCSLCLNLHQPVLLSILLPFYFAAALTFYLVIPDRWFIRTKLHPVFPPRSMAIQRITFLTALFCVLSAAQYFSGVRVWGYFVLLWAVPLMTSFSLFMILRQLVQHGNGDRGWLTNTRVFLVNPVINYAVFPFGMDYHLPHHMFATIPHYRLPELHKLLQDYPEYREQGVVVEGYFSKRHPDQCTPTVLEVLGPDYAPTEQHETFIDHSVVEDWKKSDR